MSGQLYEIVKNLPFSCSSLKVLGHTELELIAGIRYGLLYGVPLTLNTGSVQIHIHVSFIRN